jgi:hypothetical protein
MNIIVIVVSRSKDAHLNSVQQQKKNWVVSSGKSQHYEVSRSKNYPNDKNGSLFVHMLCHDISEANSQSLNAGVEWLAW